MVEMSKEEALDEEIKRLKEYIPIDILESNKNESNRNDKNKCQEEIGGVIIGI